MAKIQPTNKNRKLTAAGLDSCKDALAASHPIIAGILGDQKHLDRLENVLANGGLNLNEEQTPHTFQNQMNPPGTAEWVFEVFPCSKAHFCLLLIEAEEMETTLRDLAANYNFTGIDPDDISSFLSTINGWCNLLRSLAAIQSKRARAIAQVERITKPRPLDPEHSPHRA